MLRHHLRTKKTSDAQFGILGSCLDCSLSCPRLPEDVGKTIDYRPYQILQSSSVVRCSIDAMEVQVQNLRTKATQLQIAVSRSEPNEGRKRAMSFSGQLEMPVGEPRIRRNVMGFDGVAAPERLPQ